MRRELTQDEKLVEAKKQEMKKERPKWSDLIISHEIRHTPEWKLQEKNERENNLSELDKEAIKFRNSIENARNKLYANLYEASRSLENFKKCFKDECEKARNSYKKECTKSKNDIREWLINMNYTPFDISAEDNSKQYMLDYETMCFLAKFLFTDPVFEEIFNNKNFDVINQPFCWMFDWILQYDASSSNMLEEKIKMHSKSFATHGEMMIFIIKNIIEESPSFCRIFNCRLEIIYRFEKKSMSECRGCEFGQLLPIRTNANKVAEDLSSNPQISLPACSKSNSLATQNCPEKFSSLHIVSQHDLVIEYEPSHLKTRARRIESQKSHNDEYPLQFQLTRTSKSGREIHKRKIRAIAFKSISTAGKIMLNYITLQALKDFKEEEVDSLLQRMISCASFVLYEDKENVRFGYIWP